MSTGTATWSAPSISIGRTARPPADRRAQRMPGLDGLRAVAVLAVVFFHLDDQLLPGGFLGVDVFFVISGVLITHLLTRELVTTGRLDLAGFFARRARRLLPTVVAVVAVVAVVSALFWRDELATLGGSALASLGFSANWWLVYDHQSYFVATGRPPMLQHLWSLAIEEQYYLVWTAVTVAVVGSSAATRRWGVERRLQVLAALALVLAAASTIAMLVHALADDLPYGGSVSRVYFGTDTHAAGLLLGSAGGAWLTLRDYRAGLRAPSPRPRARRHVWATDLLGLCALVLVVRTLLDVDEYRPGLYRGGFLLLDAVVLVAVLCAVRRGAWLGRLLDVAPLRWVGRRSFSIYVWHWPLVVVTRPDLDVQGDRWVLDAARLAAVLALGAAGFRFVEDRFRVARPRRGTAARRARPPVLRLIGATAAVGLLAACAASTQTPPATPSSPVRAISTHPSTHRPAAHPRPHEHAPRVTRQRPAVPARPAVSAFGDSVLLGAQDALQAGTSALRLDAVEGRQAVDVLNDVAQAAHDGTLEPVVVIHVGDNGIIDPAQLRSTLDDIGPRHHVVLLTLRVPRDWESPNNTVIRAAAQGRSNVTLLDWDALSGQHPDWLYPDGIHLRPAGAGGYAAAVLRAARATRS